MDKPVSAQAEAGNVKILRAPWNDDLLRELENFPTGRHDDQCDALSGAHAMIAGQSGPVAQSIRRGESSREMFLGPSLRGNNFRAEITSEHPMYQSSRGSSRSPLL